MKRSYEAPRLAKHEQLGAITAQYYISPPFPPPPPGDDGDDVGDDT